MRRLAVALLLVGCKHAPADAGFEGEVEILIDSTGRVAKARVVRSIPMLDASALQTVYQWRFSPAIKNGHPVATIAHAPVMFRIY